MNVQWVGYSIRGQGGGRGDADESTHKLESDSLTHGGSGGLGIGSAGGLVSRHWLGISPDFSAGNGKPISYYGCSAEYTLAFSNSAQRATGCTPPGDFERSRTGNHHGSGSHHEASAGTQPTSSIRSTGYEFCAEFIRSGAGFLKGEIREHSRRQFRGQSGHRRPRYG